MQPKKPNLYSVAFLLILAGAILRFTFLGKHNLWYDEAASFIIAQKDYISAQSPLYYHILKFSSMVFGTSEWALRMPSAVFSTLSLIFVYLLAKKLAGRHIALLTLAITALSAFHIWYAQEARAYALVLLLGTAGTFFLYSFLRDPKNKKHLLLYICFSTLGLYSSYFYIVLFIFQQIYVLSTLKKPLYFKMLFLVPILLMAEQYMPFLRTLLNMARGFWIETPIPNSILITFENFLLGYNGTTILYFFSSLLTLLTFFSCILLCSKKAPEKKEITFLFTLSFLPILFIFIFSKVFFSIYLDRALLIFSPYYYILLAMAVASLKFKMIRIPVIVFIITASSVSTLRYFSDIMYEPFKSRHHLGTWLKKPYAPLADFLKANLRKNDRVLFAYLSPIYPVYYYMKVPENDFLSFSSHAYDPEAIDTNTNMPFKNALKKRSFYFNTYDSLDVLTKTGGRIFLIGGSFQRDSSLDENSRIMKAYFDRAMARAGSLDFDGIKVFIYENKDPALATLISLANIKEIK